MLQTAQTPVAIFILTAGIELNVYLRSPGPHRPGFSCFREAPKQDAPAPFWTSRAHQCHNGNNKRGFVPARFHRGGFMSSRSSRFGNIPAKRSHRAAIPLLVLSMLAASGAALAQTTQSIRSQPVPPSDKDEVPPGGCTPIGLTASGEIVFPFTCKGFLERRRGPIEDPKPAAQAEKPAGTEKAETAAAPALAAVPAKTEPLLQPAEADSSTTASIGEPKPADDGKKRRPRGKRHPRVEPAALAGRNF